MDFMQLYKMPKYGTYYIRYSRTEVPPDGKLISMRKIVGRSITDPDEAQQVFDGVKKTNLKSKMAELQRGRRISLEDFSKEYIEDPGRADLSPDTLRMDALALKSLGNVVGHSRAVRAVNSSDLKKFKQVCLDRGLSVWSVISYMGHIKAALNFAVEAGYRQKAPRVPRMRRPQRLPKVIPSHHLDVLLPYLKANDFEIWRYAEFALATGCRLSEIHGLTGPDITMYEQPNQKVYGRARIIGKGDKERNTPLIKEALAAMGSVPDIGPVFLQHHPDNISHRIRAAVKACGLDGLGITMHALRHTAATRMVEKGYRLEIIQQILGHSDIRTTQIYATIYDQVVEDEINRRG